MDTVYQIQKIVTEPSAQDTVKFWTELIGIPIGIISVIILIIQTYLGNKSRKEELKSKEEELKGKKEELQNKRVEMRWNQLAKAKELVDEMRNDKDANKAMTILDYMFPLFDGKEATVNNIRNALSFSYKNPIHNSIRDSFDSLFYYYALFEYHVATGLVEFGDISFPAEYYIRHMKEGIHDIDVEIFMNYMEVTRADRTLKFIRRFDKTM
jgi:hypothetical protein